MPTDLILICHGQARRRDGENHYGWWADMPLSHRGKQQAMLIGERLRNDFDIHSLYTSPKKCTRQTAEWIGDVLRLRIVPEIEDDLRELESGTSPHSPTKKSEIIIPGFLSGESSRRGTRSSSETYADLQHPRCQRP